MRACEVQVKQLLCDEGIIQKTDVFVPLSGGRTNSVWKISGSVELICKLYSENTQNPLYENAPASEYACLKHLSGKSIAPEPRAFMTAGFGQVLVYEYLHGIIWDQDVASVADLLSRIHNEMLPNGLRDLPVGADALTEQSLGILAALEPERAETLRALQPIVEVTFVNPLRFIHTDVVPGNIIQTNTGLRLIDWQCPGIGDPVEDLMMFLSPAMHYIYRGRLLTDAERQDFLAAYPDKCVQERCKQLAPIYHWRMAAYCAWKQARGDDGYGDAMLLEIEALEQLR